MHNKLHIENSIFEILEAIIEDYSVSETNVDRDLTKIGMDSLKFINVVVEIEKAFNFELPNEYLIIDKMNTPNKIINIVLITLNIT